MLKLLSRYFSAVFFVAAGLMHFLHPEAYLPLVPPILPWPLALIYVSGAAEILGGLGLLPSITRRWAGIWLVLLLIAVFPANIHMLVAKPAVLGMNPPDWILWARLPLQAVLIVCVWWTTRPSKLLPLR